MTSTAQRAANRANAACSTGPRTAEGKRRSALNALKHGILSRALVSVESPPDQALFRALYRGLVDELAPVGVIETLLVERIAACLWRLRRVAVAEAQVIERGPSTGDSLFDAVYDALEAKLDVARGVERAPESAAPARPDYPTALPAPDRLALYTRYEAGLERQLYRALDRLMLLQAVRRRPVSECS